MLTKLHDGRTIPSDIRVIGQDLGGAIMCFIPIDLLYTDDRFQRAVRPTQSKRIAKDFDYNYFGEITVAEGSTYGLDRPGLFHIIEGNTRFYTIKSKTRDNRYIEEHADIIPAGYKVGDKAVMRCLIIDRNPVTAFERLNDSDRCKEWQKFHARINDISPANFMDEKDVFRLLSKYGILVQGSAGKRSSHNITKSAQVLTPFWKIDRSVVEGAIEIINDVYRKPPSDGLIEREALSSAFMTGLCKCLLDSGHTTRTLKIALKWAWKRGFIAERIVTECVGSGTGVKQERISIWMTETVRQYKEYCKTKVKGK